MKAYRLPHAVAFAGLIMGFWALGIWMLYCLNNHSGHSGADPRLISLGFLPIIATGIYCLMQGSLQDRCGWMALFLGIFGLGFGFFVDLTGILREYSRWAQGGLKDPPDSASLLITGYCFLILLALLGVIVILKKVRL